jgi:hypothetical protein
MSARSKLDPREHICGEWNIISMNRYMPVSNGDKYTPKYKKDPALVERAHSMYTDGMMQTEIAVAIGVPRAVIGFWKKQDWRI